MLKKQEEVCKLLGIHQEILNLPKGYQTVLENSGKNVSARLKQPLSVARSVLTKAKVLLFDEVTSSLDMQTTQQVVQVLQRLKKDHTIIIITHKPELMKLADHIIILHKGRKVGDGTNWSLQQNRYYQKLQQPVESEASQQESLRKL